MTHDEKKLMKKWVETWKRAGPILEEIRKDELRNFDYQKNKQIIDEMLQWAIDHAKPRLSSGLVEQQRWFMKMREKLEKEGKL
jgi:hypothetical protein